MSKQTKKTNQKRYGIFYRSHGKWSGPYQGLTFTEYSIGRNPIKGYISMVKNYRLKTRVKIKSVETK